MIGAGLMGHGIAQVFALSGRDVFLNDANPDSLSRARAGIAANLDLFAREGVISRAEGEMALGHIHLEPDLAAAVARAEYITEVVFEDLAVKQEVFTRLDALAAPEVIIASNTSGLSANGIVRDVKRRAQCLVTHFWNPPHILPLVEVVRNDQTSDSTVATVTQLLRAIGKVPVVVQKDIPGQIGNRLQYALFREAVALVQSGVCSPEDVDTVIKMSFGRRLSTIGILETVDVNGTSLWADISHYLFRELDTSDDTLPYHQDLIRRGRTGVRAGAGFHDWPAERLAETLGRRDAELLRWLKLDRAARPAVTAR